MQGGFGICVAFECWWLRASSSSATSTRSPQAKDKMKMNNGGRIQGGFAQYLCTRSPDIVQNVKKYLIQAECSVALHNTGG